MAREPAPAASSGPGSDLSAANGRNWPSNGAVEGGPHHPEPPLEMGHPSNRRSRAGRASLVGARSCAAWHRPVPDRACTRSSVHPIGRPKAHASQAGNDGCLPGHMADWRSTRCASDNIRSPSPNSLNAGDCSEGLGQLQSQASVLLAANRLAYRGGARQFMWDASSTTPMSWSRNARFLPASHQFFCDVM
jgi:hypothetical protein